MRLVYYMYVCVEEGACVGNVYVRGVHVIRDLI